MSIWQHALSALGGWKRCNVSLSQLAIRRITLMFQGSRN